MTNRGKVEGFVAAPLTGLFSPLIRECVSVGFFVPETNPKKTGLLVQSNCIYKYIFKSIQLFYLYLI